MWSGSRSINLILEKYQRVEYWPARSHCIVNHFLMCTPPERVTRERSLTSYWYTTFRFFKAFSIDLISVSQDSIIPGHFPTSRFRENRGQSSPIRASLINQSKLSFNINARNSTYVPPTSGQIIGWRIILLEPLACTDTSSSSSSTIVSILLFDMAWNRFETDLKFS